MTRATLWRRTRLMLGLYKHAVGGCILSAWVSPVDWTEDNREWGEGRKAKFLQSPGGSVRGCVWLVGISLTISDEAIFELVEAIQGLRLSRPTRGSRWVAECEKTEQCGKCVRAFLTFAFMDETGKLLVWQAQLSGLLSMVFADLGSAPMSWSSCVR